MCDNLIISSLKAYNYTFWELFDILYIVVTLIWIFYLGLYISKLTSYYLKVSGVGVTHRYAMAGEKVIQGHSSILGEIRLILSCKYQKDRKEIHLPDSILIFLLIAYLVLPRLLFYFKVDFGL